MQRQLQQRQPARFDLGCVVFDHEAESLRRGGCSVALTLMEVKFLHRLCAEATVHPGRGILTRQLALELDTSQGSIWNFASHVREKLARLGGSAEVLAQDTSGYRVLLRAVGQPAGLRRDEVPLSKS